MDSKNFDCQIYVCVYKQQYQYESNVRYPKILQYHYNNFKTWAKSLVPHGFNFDTVSHRSCQQSMGPSQKPTELGTDFTSRGKKGLNPALQPNGNDWKQELCISRTIETNVNNQPFLMNGDEPFCAQFVNFLPMSHVWNSMNGWIERRPTLGSHMGSRRKYMLSCSSPFRFPWFGIHTHSFFTKRKTLKNRSSEWFFMNCFGLFATCLAVLIKLGIRPHVVPAMTYIFHGDLFPKKNWNKSDMHTLVTSLNWFWLSLWMERSWSVSGSAEGRRSRLPVG